MWIAISKKANSNQWDYPDTPGLFVDGFRDGSTLIVRYTGTKTAAELGALEYAGELPNSTGVRVISPRAFYKRLPASVKAEMRTTTDANLLDLMGEFDRASYFDLDDEDTIDAINGMIGLGLMTSGDAIEQLADGTEREKYNGPL